MHLQLVLSTLFFGLLVGCVCSRYVPRAQLSRVPTHRQSQPTSYYRPRRYTLSDTTLPVYEEQIVATNKKSAEKRYAHADYREEEIEEHAPANYEFKYDVHDEEHRDIKSHEEKRQGEHTVGQYSVLQPDGTILTVKYTVHGDEGFNAVVSKSEAII